MEFDKNCEFCDICEEMFEELYSDAGRFPDKPGYSKDGCCPGEGECLSPWNEFYEGAYLTWR